MLKLKQIPRLKQNLNIFFLIINAHKKYALKVLLLNVFYKTNNKITYINVYVYRCISIN